MVSLINVLSSGKARRGTLAIWPYVLVASLACSLVLLSPDPAVAQTGPVVQNDFEDGTLQGWIPRGGGVVLTNTTEAAANGTHSLKTTGRTASFHGPSLNLTNTLSRGTLYRITASVRLVSGQAADTLKITMQRTPVGGSNAFDQIATSATNGVTDGAWVTLQGTYSFTTDVSGLLLYIEATGATTQYYVDDFSIQVAPALGCSVPQDNSGIHTNFETGRDEGWKPRIGRETLTVTTADAHSGTYSLLSTGRQATFDGPSLNAAGKLCNGSRYNISLWAKLAPGQPNSQLRVSIQRTLSGTTNFNTVIPNTTVTADQWVRLRATYDFAFNYDTLTLYVESASGTPSFYIDDFDLTFVPPPVAERDIPSVYQSLAEFFPIGAAIWQGDLSGEHAVLLTKHFNSITSENDMKWSSVEPTQGTFTFTNADAQVSFARANNMLVRGHTLVWHEQVPAWVFKDASGNDMTPTLENKTLLLQRMENHIRAVVSHFGNNVYAWDVVNEVIDPAQPDGFRRSPWFNITGTEYIERAFQIAHEVAPNAKLYINDYDTTNTTKRMFLYNLVRDLKSRGVPIDGVGHQMHNNINFPSTQAIIETINLFSDLGMDNQITELDVSIYSGSNPVIYDDYALIPQDLLVRQGYKYRDFFQAFRQLKGKISSVTFWGQADDHTWLSSPTRVNAPLLFDTSLRHKFAYLGVIDPLKLPGADLVTTISAAPNPVLSGNNVTYTITVKNVGQSNAADDLPATNVSLVDVLPAGATFQSLTAPAGWSCTTPAVGGTGRVQCTTRELAVGAAAQFTLTVAVACAAPDCTELVNSANATSTTADPNPAPNNTASVNVRVYTTGMVVQPPAQTPVGANVTIRTEVVNVTFAGVNAAGTTTVAASRASSAGRLPSGFSLLNADLAYDINSTATFTGPITLCFKLPTITDPALFSAIKILHAENGALVDRTILPPDEPSPDFDSQTVCARADSLGPFVLALSPANSIQFSAASYQVAENDPSSHALINVTRTGDISASASVNYSTVDNPAAVACSDTTTMPGVAFARCDYATTVDTLRFAPGEAQKSFIIPITDDTHVEGAETFQIQLSNAVGATLGRQTQANVIIMDDDRVSVTNPIKQSQFFVRQQYLDFLSREPEPDGLNAWLGVLNQCPNVENDPTCDRITVSASFFQSQEFQLKGYFVYLFYRVALNRRPHYDEIIPDMRRVTGQTPEEVYAKKSGFTDAFVRRQEFKNLYGALTNGGYVDALLSRYGIGSITTIDPANPDGSALVTLTRDQLVSRLEAHEMTRAQVLRAIVQSKEVDRVEYNGAFVAMEYYGYLRREPEQSGYDAWLKVINRGDSYRVMVDGFMNSDEYKQRFGPPRP